MAFWGVYGCMAVLGGTMRYAVYSFVFIAVIVGVFGTGYWVGSSDKQVEYVTKEIEVIKYVEKKKAEIYSRPNASRDILLNLMYNGKL